MLTAILAIGILAALFGLLLGYAAIRFKVEGDPIVDPRVVDANDVWVVNLAGPFDGLDELGLFVGGLHEPWGHGLERHLDVELGVPRPIDPARLPRGNELLDLPAPLNDVPRLQRRPTLGRISAAAAR